MFDYFIWIWLVRTKKKSFRFYNSLIFNIPKNKLNRFINNANCCVTCSILTRTICIRQFLLISSLFFYLTHKIIINFGQPVQRFLFTTFWFFLFFSFLFHWAISLLNCGYNKSLALWMERISQSSIRICTNGIEFVLKIKRSCSILDSIIYSSDNDR